MSFLKDEEKESWGRSDWITLLVILLLAGGFYWYYTSGKEDTMERFAAADKLWQAREYDKAFEAYQELENPSVITDSLRDSVLNPRLRWLRDREAYQDSWKNVLAYVEKGTDTVKMMAAGDLGILKRLKLNDSLSQFFKADVYAKMDSILIVAYPELKDIGKKSEGDSTVNAGADSTAQEVENVETSEVDSTADSSNSDGTDTVN